MKKYIITIIFCLIYKLGAIELPEVPTLPIAKSGEIVFAIRNVSEKVDLKVDEFWTNKYISREPVKNVKHQTLFSSVGSWWVTSYITVSISAKSIKNLYNKTFSIAAMRGKKDFGDITYFETKEGKLEKDFNSVYHLTNEKLVTPEHKLIDKNSMYEVFLETYKTGNGDILLLCVADKDTAHKCKIQN